MKVGLYRRENHRLHLSFNLHKVSGTHGTKVFRSQGGTGLEVGMMRKIWVAYVGSFSTTEKPC